MTSAIDHHQLNEDFEMPMPYASSAMQGSPQERQTSITDKPNPFIDSPEGRRASIYILLGKMSALDGAEAVNSLLLESVRYFRHLA